MRTFKLYPLLCATLLLYYVSRGWVSKVLPTFCSALLKSWQGILPVAGLVKRFSGCLGLHFSRVYSAVDGQSFVHSSQTYVFSVLCSLSSVLLARRIQFVQFSYPFSHNCAVDRLGHGGAHNQNQKTSQVARRLRKTQGTGRRTQEHRPCPAMARANLTPTIESLRTSSAG